MIIECPECEAKVDGAVLKEYEYYEEFEGHLVCEWKAILLKCPKCRNPILGKQEGYTYDPDIGVQWTDCVREWPMPARRYNFLYIPEIVRVSLEEAEKCFKGKAFHACAVMCGRALEGMCMVFNADNKNIFGGLKELLDNKIIDERLYKWGEALRKHRNIGAHATNEKISREDAADLMEFANAFCEYVFVLSKKFDDFMKRKETVESSE
jgi:hypothetical protein